MSRKAFPLIDPGFHRDDTEVHRTAEDGFTLIELLVVIAIIAVLAVVVVLVLSPGQLILQSRDSTRIQDIASLQDAISLYQTDQSINGSVSLGSVNTIYVSIPDPSATTTLGDQCQGLGLLALPTGYTYHCAASSTYRNVNGSGWIPVNFTTMTQGSPLGQLPIDPVNTSSTRTYDTYTTNGSTYELTTDLESSKDKLGGSNDEVSNDGGALATVYEKGTKLGLEPLDYGDPNLVGYWTFDEGSGSIAYDYSGMNATGSWQGTQAGLNSTYYTTGKVGGYAGYFNGSNDALLTNTNLTFSSQPNFSCSMWFNAQATTSAETVLVVSGSSQFCRFILNDSGAGSVKFNFKDISGPSESVLASSSYTPNVWEWIMGTWDGSVEKIYVNGILNSSASVIVNLGSGGPSSALIGNDGIGPPLYQGYNGLGDDIRVYSRALSASEVQAMYNGGK